MPKKTNQEEPKFTRVGDYIIIPGATTKETIIMFATVTGFMFIFMMMILIGSKLSQG